MSGAPEQRGEGSEKEIFARASELRASERAEFLAGACGGDPRLRARIESLLSALDEAGAGGFLGAPTGPDRPTGGLVDVVLGADVLHERPGSRIGPYKLLQVIGEGGFGTVFMAEQEKPVVRRVAIKIIKLGMDTRQVIARFEAERQALAMMDHPNIARVLDAGATETGRPYFVMELVKGEPVTEYCDRHNLGIPERLELFEAVCHAVQHAHQKGIIHRDIKPSNVLVTSTDGKAIPKVIDFGIAKATSARLTEKTLFTEHRQLIGTPEYMSPEQAEMTASDIDTRSDIYSLGVLLYELLTGALPFDSKRLRSAVFGEIQRIIREEEPPKPSTRLSTLEALPSIAASRDTDPGRLSRSVRGDLDWIVMKALEKDRTRRYETANGLAADVRRHLAGEAVVAAPPSVVYRLRKFVRRNKGPAVAGALVAAALVLGVIGTTIGLIEARRQRELVIEQRNLAAGALARVAREVELQARESPLSRVLKGISLSPDPASAAREEHGLKGLVVAASPGREVEDLAASTIALLQKLDAARRAESEQRRRAEAINQFVTRSLQSSDPNQHGAQGVTVAEAMTQALANLDRGDLKEQPATVADLLRTIAHILDGNGRSAEAEAPAERALTIEREQHPGDHPEVASSLNILALVRLSLGRASEAEPLFVQAMEMQQRLFSGDHPDMATSLGNIAHVRWLLGRESEAEHLYVQALEMQRRLYVGDHPDVARAMNSLASVREAMGRAAEAETLYVQALEMRQRLFSGDHPDVATSLNNLASVRYALGRAAEAEPLFAQVLEMNQRLFRGDHRDIARSLNNLAAVRQVLGRAAESEPLYVRALEMRQRLFPGDHPDVALNLNTLAGVRLSLGRAAEAEPLFVRSLEMFQRLFKGDHSSVARSLSSLARCLAALDRFPEALARAQEASDMAGRILPVGHPTRTICDDTLAGINAKIEASAGGAPTPK